MKDFIAHLNAWHVVAIGAGATLTHIYHAIVKAGGMKKLWNAFWDGPADPLK